MWNATSSRNRTVLTGRLLGIVIVTSLLVFGGTWKTTTSVFCTGGRMKIVTLAEKLQSALNPLFANCIVLYLSISIALLTASAFPKRSLPQQLTQCRKFHAEALQATVSEGLARGPYVG